MATCSTRVKASEEQFEVLLDNVMDNFNFTKVHDVMVQLDWRWVDKSTGELLVPSVYRLMETARRHLRVAYAEELTVCSGGLEATYTPGFEGDKDDPAGFLNLKFVLTEWDSEGCPIP